MYRIWSWLNMGLSGVVLEVRGLLNARSPHTLHVQVVVGLDNPLLQFQILPELLHPFGAQS